MEIVSAEQTMSGGVIDEFILSTVIGKRAEGRTTRGGRGHDEREPLGTRVRIPAWRELVLP